MMTSYEAVRRTRAVLTEHGLPDAAFEGDILVQEVMGVRQPVRTLPERTLTEAQQETLADMTRRRCCHEPLQYLCGAWEFYGLPFSVGEGVLIPRQDTEVLVDEVLPYIQTLGSCRVLDLCAGSGCIGLALASQAPQAHVVLGEFSDGALRICRQNTRRTALTGRVIPMTVNALERPDRALGEFHCIVSNPPYIPHGDIPGLDHSVKDYEPHLALDGGEDGLDFYHAICDSWGELLVPNGRLLFECGWHQADDVAGIMQRHGYKDVTITEDYSGVPRIVYGTNARPDVDLTRDA